MTESFINRIEKNQIIDQQYRLQRLLISISTEYINADLTDIDGLINQSLKQMGTFVMADRSYIFSYDFEKNSTSNTYEWCAEGIEPEIQNLQEIPTDIIPFWVEAHKRREALYIQNVDLLPDDGELGLRAILEPQGIKSLITIPMIKEGELIGFVGFDSVKKIFNYSENEKNILFVFANMLVNVKKRKESEIFIKEQKEKKEILLKSLESQNKELGEYAHMLSHDLKSPLLSINALTSWIKEDYKEVIDKDGLEKLDLIQENVDKLYYIFNGISEYSKVSKTENKFKSIEIQSVFASVIKKIETSKLYELMLPEKLPTIHGDFYSLERLFSNIVENGIKFNNKEIALITVNFTEEDNYWKFSISDNGNGIESCYFDKIFTAFKKLENDEKSSGIGLSIVKKIIELYQGKIWLESTINVGTTFYFTLKK